MGLVFGLGISCCFGGFLRPFPSGKGLKILLEPGADEMMCCPGGSQWLLGELGSLAETQKV